MKKMPFLLKLLFLLFPFPLLAQGTGTPVLTVEYQALVDFYNATNGASWSKKWDVSVNNIHEGGWYGVLVEGNHIVGLDLKSNNLKGVIPASFSNLKYLRSLVLSYGYPYAYNDLSTADLNNLSGLESLESLGMTYCNLKGSIPASWSKLIKMKALDLGNNGFEGAIFNEIGDLKNIMTIDLRGNKFTSIPTTISSLTELNTLNLSYNKLTVLPKELEALGSLTYLDVSNNEISNIEALLATNINISLYSQTLTFEEFAYKGGDVTLKNLPNITRYDRSKNNFSALNNFLLYINGAYVGTNIAMRPDSSLVIPKQYLSTLKKGDDIYLYQNSGSAYTLKIYFKKITIDLPAVPNAEYQALVDFYNATNGANWFHKWDVSVNNLNEGAWPGTSIMDSHIVAINLGSNNIKGAIPASFSNLKYLKTLNLSYSYPYQYNDLSTTDLTNLSGLDSLENLGLSYCNLKGAIPASWSKLNKLTGLDLSNNLLEGAIFNEIGDLKNLVTVDLGGNKFTSIPNTIGSLTKLKTLYLSNNKLTILPKALESLSSLTSLDVRNNEINDIQALLSTNISVSFYYQTLTLEELVYKGGDVKLKNLPNIIRYDRSKNDFSALNSFGLYIRGSYITEIKMNSDSSLTIPKQYLSSLKKGDDIYLYQNTGSAYTLKMYFKKITIELPAIPDAEYQALVDFYNATNGKDWRNQWDVSINNLNEGSWYGVSIEESHIVGIDLKSNNIKGAIPASFGNLKYLKTVDLSYGYPYWYNDLSTTDLNNLSALDSLENLRLSYCNLKDTIPSSWSKLTKLRNLNLHNNNMEGSALNGISHLTNIEAMDLSSNKFTSFPIEINGLANLKTLNLTSNKLTLLPKVLEKISNLNSLDVSYNQISTVQAFLKNTVYMYLNTQTLLLDELVYKGEDILLKNLPNITRYDRSKNDFSALNNFSIYIRGSYISEVTMNADSSLVIPKQYLSSLKKGDDVYLYQTTGTAAWTKINFKKVTINIPAIPDSEYQALVDFYNATNGKGWNQQWDVTTNNLNEGGWYGISIEGNHIVGIDLKSNNIKGEIPASFSNLKYLKKLNLSWGSPYQYNDLSAANLTYLSGLDSLEELGLSYCNIKGMVPGSWSKLSKLKFLNLESNKISNIDQNFANLKLKSLGFASQEITVDSIEIGANEINIDLPLHLVVSLENQVITFDAKNEFQLYVNGHSVKTAFSNNGKLVFTDINLLNLKETDKIRIWQADGICVYSSINYGKVTFGKPLVNEEFEILKKIYSATNGASWTNKWDTIQNNLNKVSWFGVSLKDGHVISINLFNNNLSGNLPEEITGLKFLKTLNAGSNKLTGSMPQNIHVLSDLEVLDLNSNSLSGNIPSNISDLQKLKKFTIGNNKFSGAIPSALSDFKVLEHLDLSSNSFDTIEKKLYYDFSKTYIDLRNQKINYNIVLNVDDSKLKVNLSDIVKYDLEKNNFEAKNTFALLVNNITHATTVANEFGEIIFDNVKMADIPVNAKIAVRQISGTFINTEFNYAGIEDKSNIQVVESEYLALVQFYNQLNGSSWSNKWDVTNNNLHTKKWFGVTTYNGHIVSVNLTSNNVSGNLPTIFDKLPYLTKLNLTSNKLTGITAALPASINFTFDRQSIRMPDVKLTASAVINDLSINKYEHSKKGFYNQTYDLTIGNFSKTVNVAENGIKLTDLMRVWTVPDSQQVVLKQISGDAKNSIINYTLRFKRGDANMDDKLNVLDIQTTINYILNNDVNYFNFTAADVNKDKKINILDVTELVKIIQNQPPQKFSNEGPALKQDVSKAKLSIENGFLMLDVAGYDISGLEIRMNNLTKDAVQELISSSGFTVNIAEKNNQVCMLAYSFENILKGKIALAKITESTMTVLSAILSDPQAVEVPVELTDPVILGITDLVHATPSKINNHPNPFSDETIIEVFSAKDLGAATLSVYNAIGIKAEETIPFYLAKGVNQYKFSKGKLSAGVYFYVVQSVDKPEVFMGQMTIQ